MDDDQVPSDDEFGGRCVDFSRHCYLYIDESLRALAKILTKWNRTAVEAGSGPPYQEEFERIQGTLDYFTPRLDAAQQQYAYFFEIGRVSVGAVRLGADDWHSEGSRVGLRSHVTETPAERNKQDCSRLETGAARVQSES